MTASIKNRAENLEGPANDGFAIIPDDDATLPSTTRALYVGGDGSVTVEMMSGATLTFAAVMAGTLLPIRARKVLEATTATLIVGLT